MNHTTDTFPKTGRVTEGNGIFYYILKMYDIYKNHNIKNYFKNFI